MNRIALAIAALSISFAMTAAAGSETPLGVTPEQREAMGIRVGHATPRPLVPRPRLPGRVILPNDRVRLVTARSEGVLISPAVAVGDVVVADQELARIESPAFVSLQREFLDALSQRDLARTMADREAELAREGIIPAHRALGSAAALLDARARLAEGRQSLALSGMGAEQIAALERTRRFESSLALRAPFSGVVLEQFAQAGARLSAGDLLYRIGDLSELSVEIHVPLDVARELGEGTRFQLLDQAATGVVSTVGSQVHSLDQGVLVRGRIDQGTASLRPGQFVSVQLETSRTQGLAFAIPATALVHADARAWIFELVEGGFLPVAVEIVGGIGRERVIVGPLDAETELAIRGTAALKAYWLSNGGPP